MDQASLVNEQITDGRRYLERLGAEGVPVTAGAWVKKSEGGPWIFFIVTPLVTEEDGIRPALRRVGPLLIKMPQPFWVDPLEIAVAAPDSPVGKAIRDVADRSPGPVPVPYGNTLLGGVSIEGAYVYPPLAAPVG